MQVESKMQTRRIRTKTPKAQAGTNKETKEKEPDKDTTSALEITAASEVEPEKTVDDKDSGDQPPSEEATEEKAKEESEVAERPHYHIHDKVLCKHVDNLYYEAKIIAVEQQDSADPVYTVHYQGWNQRHDEKIPHSNTAQRFLDYTPANVEKAKADMKDAQIRMQQAKKKSRKSIVGSGEDKKAEGSESRGSTPSEKRGASSSRAPSISSEKGAVPTGSVSSRKRKQQSDVEPIPDFVRKNEITIEIPNVLKDILVDDQDMVVRQMYLCRLPARYTVAEIIRQYADYMGTSVEARDTLTFDYSAGDAELKTMIVTLIESSLGVQDFFDSTLGSQLLYKFERPQYSDLIAEQQKKEPNKEKELSASPTKRRRAAEVVTPEEPLSTEEKFKPSDYYGFVHLLRLFVRFGSMISLTNWTERSIQSIVNHVHNFLKFLEANRHKFFDVDSDYEVASPEYQRRVWTT